MNEAIEELGLTPKKETMTENGFPKYQWSIFVKGKDEQFVTRNDNWDEFVKQVEKVRDQFDKKNGTPSQPVSDGLTSMCADHGVPMQQGFSQAKQKHYWYHDSPEGARCFGKGFQPKR